MSMAFDVILLVFLIICALMVAYTKNMLAAVVIFASYSLVMAIIWQMLDAPDIAITEAAVGAGITTLLFVAAIRKTGGAKK